MMAATMEQSPNRGCAYCHTESSIAPPEAPTFAGDEKTKMSHKSQQNGWSVACQRSRMHESIGKGKTINFERKRSVDGYHQRHRTAAAAETNWSQGQVFTSESEENPMEQIDAISRDNSHHCGHNHARLRRQSSQYSDRGRKSKNHSSTSLSYKYQPKSFQDIIGHEIITKVISNAVHKKKIAPLYLFHGPNGTGKTSTARIFSMALQCESTSITKPCWSCRGCSRSLSVMKLYSGSSVTGFQRISTLLRSTSFTQAVQPLQVFIIKESHSPPPEAWDELLGILENMQSANLVFVLITVDANMIAKSISSRCQKFFFPRLKNTDVMLKLARIAEQEDIGIEKEALKLIAMKAEGSLREAEYLLDQLTLLGPRITSFMVQQLVGLVPLKKLINLLRIALFGDNEEILIATRELIATGVETQAIVFQLASLITDLLSETAITIPSSSMFVGPSKEKRLLTNFQSERLCNALKILVDAKKQTRSSNDIITQIYAALLQIAPQNIPTKTRSEPNDIISPLGNKPPSENHHSISRNSTQPTVDRISRQTIEKSKLNGTNECMEKITKCSSKEVDREFNLACRRDMEEIWLNIVENIQSTDMKEFLSSHVKLASITLTCANAIVHLMFKRPEDKLVAQMSEESISKALISSIGRPVTINTSVEPLDIEIIQECNASMNKSYLDDRDHSIQWRQNLFLSQLVYDKDPGITITMNQSEHTKSTPPSEIAELRDSVLISQGQDESSTRETKEISTGTMTNSLAMDQFKSDTSNIMRTEEPKHRWLSLSSIQQSDASVEPYSQDIFFENEYIDRESRTRRNAKQQGGSSKIQEELHLQGRTKSMRLFRAWSCKEALGQRKTKERTM